MKRELGVIIPAIADRYGVRGGRLVVAVAGVVLLTLPLWATAYVVNMFTTIGLYSVLALGLVLLTGLAGQVSLCQAMFYGVGAYTSALLAVRLGIPPALALVSGAAAAGLVAAPLGRAILRLRGIIVAGVTLTVNLGFFYLVKSAAELTGGATGLYLIPRLDSPGGMSYSSFIFFVVWGVVILCLGLTSNLVKSRIGRALKSMNVLAGGSEDTAQVLGIDVMHFKVGVYIVAAVFAGLIAIMAIVGGVTNPWGAILGATLIVGITEVFREVAPVVLGGATGAYELVAYGVVLVLTLLFLPEGLFSLPTRLRKRHED